MIGCNVSADNEEGKYYVVDQAKINGMMYLLVKDEDGKYAIVKIVNVHHFVKLSPKKVLKTKLMFTNSSYWKHNSRVDISDDGIVDYIACINQEIAKRFLFD